MKMKLMLVLGMVGILLFSVACSTASKQAQIEVTTDQLMTDKHIVSQVEVGDGGTLIVTLGSNRTTGFQWSETAKVADETVLQQTGHRYIAAETSLVGASGKEEWTFKALKKGETKVYAEYNRPWQGGEKGEWTFDLTVVVK